MATRIELKHAVEEYTAPSAWASYLFNGDASGITDTDVAQADAFVAWVGCGDPVSCEDAGFFHFHDAHSFCGLSADCQTYSFLRRKGAAK